MDIRQLSRKKLQQQRAKISSYEQKIASAMLIKKLSQLTLFLQSQTIASYQAIQNEIDPSALIEDAWKNKKKCYLPIAQDQQLLFCPFEFDTALKKNQFNIPEPPLSLNSCIAAKAIDLVLVPLLGFTEKGQRLGRGAGFYDRSFSFLLHPPRPTRPFLLGLAYEWQKLSSFAEKSWDVPLNAVITEKKIYFSPV